MDDLVIYFWMVVITGFVLSAFLLASNITSTPPSPYVGRKLMTDHEKAFFRKLEDAAHRLGGYRVFPQIAMAAVVDTRGNLSQSSALATRSTFDRRIVDFVIVDANMHVVMLVELDEQAPDADVTARRNEITEGAGHATVRFHDTQKITSEQIEDELRRI